MIKIISATQYNDFIKDKILDFYTQSPKVKEIATVPIEFLGYFSSNQLKIVSNYYTLKYKKIFKVAYFVQSEVFSDDISQQELIAYYQDLKKYFKSKGYAYINIYPTLRCGHYDIEGHLQQQYSLRQEMSDQVKMIYPQRQHFSVPNIMAIKPLLNLELDTLTQGMSTNVKRLLKTSTKEGLQIKRISVKELSNIYDVFEASAERKNFDIFCLEKMKKILSVMPDEMYVDAVYIERQTKLLQLQHQLQQATDKNKKQLFQQQIDFLQRATDEHIILGAGLFYRNQQQIFYQMGGSHQLFNRWGTMIYLMQHQIITAYCQGLQYYNFGGIFCHEIDSQAFENDSLYQFKRKFNNDLLVYGKEFIIPIKRWMTKLINLN